MEPAVAETGSVNLIEKKTKHQKEQQHSANVGIR
jgi:hypothetical protein